MGVVISRARAHPAAGRAQPPLHRLPSRPSSARDVPWRLITIVARDPRALRRGRPGARLAAVLRQPVRLGDGRPHADARAASRSRTSASSAPRPATTRCIVDLEKDTKLPVRAPRRAHALRRRRLRRRGRRPRARSTRRRRGLGRRASAATITLPHAQLYDAELDLEESYVYERDEGLFNAIGGALLRRRRLRARGVYLAAERQARRGGARRTTSSCTRAEENTRAMLDELVRSLGFERVDDPLRVAGRQLGGADEEAGGGLLAERRARRRSADRERAVRPARRRAARPSSRGRGPRRSTSGGARRRARRGGRSRRACPARGRRAACSSRFSACSNSVSTGQPCGQRSGFPSRSAIRSIISSVKVSPRRSACTCDSAGV